MNERNGPNTTPRKLKFEQLRADYELFLQTFEKPTWIYRLLQRRAQISPFMLHRNLSYIRDTYPKKKKAKQQQKRALFKVDSILAKKAETAHVKNEDDSEQAHYMNMSFGGFFHGPGFAEQIFRTSDPQLQEVFKDDFVNVDIHLVQVYHKKKNDKQQPLDVIPLGECQAPWNPRTQLLLPCTSVQISVPPVAFADNGRAIKTHLIAITVSIVVPKQMKKLKKGKRKGDDIASEPPNKKIKTGKSDNNNVSEEQIKENGDIIFNEPIEKITATFSAELIVYDKHKNCLLTNGDYELLVVENVDISNYGKHNSWENKFKNKLGPFAAYSFGPTIKFTLTWANKPAVPCKTVYKSLSDPYLHNGHTNGFNGIDECEEERCVQVPPPRIFYQFIYNNATRQQTEAREGTSCPWCGVKTRRLYGLMKHLKCCHSRFSFLYMPLKNGHRIDVCVNSQYCDGVNSKDIGFISVEDAPLKRVTQTDVIIGRPSKLKEDLSEFTQPESDELDGDSPLNVHKRSYYHAKNNQKMVSLSEYSPKEEDDRCPDWLVERTQDMIEEFTDVNEGEKKLMKIWNLHVLRNGYIADFSISEGCKTFVQEYGHEIIKNNLTRNFLIHLNNMIQVIPQSTVLDTMDLLFKLKEKMKNDVGVVAV